MLKTIEVTSLYNEEQGIIITTPVGEITMENVKTTVNEALKLSKVHHCNLLLFDIRKCSARQTLLDGFQGMRDMKSTTGLDYGHKIAVIYNPQFYPEERAQFIENVVTNRANPKFRMFTDIAEGTNWLLNYK
jgi:hypothetical protein